MDLTRPNQNKDFELRGVHHIAMVARDMHETIDFYENVLDMPLVKTVELPYGGGQHFFLDMGNEDTMAFFWFPHAPEEAPGLSAPAQLGGPSANASMHHCAMQVPAEHLEAYRDKLRSHGVKTSEILHHSDTPSGFSPGVIDSTWLSSIYFFDPNGSLMELAAWRRQLNQGDVAHEGATPDQAASYLRRQSGPLADTLEPLSAKFSGPTPSEKIQYRGINHLALVSSNMARTVDFYSNTLGMPLIKTLDGPEGQHFFFDCGAGDTLAFFWFPDGPQAVEGLSSPPKSDEEVKLISGIGSMNHLAFSAPIEKMQEYNKRLRAKGVAVTDVVLHDDSYTTIGSESNETTWVHSQYFFDPDGICLEFAASPRLLTDADIAHEGARWTDREKWLAKQADLPAGGMPLVR